MDTQDYLRIIRRNWLLIVAITALGVALSGVATYLMKPVYTSSTQLFVSTQNSGSIADLSEGSSFTQDRVRSYVAMVSTPAVLQPAIDELGLATTPVELAESVTASSDEDTVLITISVTDEDPAQAAAIASAVGTNMISAVEQLERPADGSASPVKLSTVTPAEQPTEPSAPQPVVNLALGFLVGLMLGVAFAILRTVSDTRVRNVSDVGAVTDRPVLGQIPIRTRADSDPLVAASTKHSPAGEAFQQLRTNLQFVQVDHKAQAIVVTSSVPGEGKSTTSVNLAISLARSGAKVLLVDADLRRPKVDDYLGLERNAGLTTALLGQAEVEDLLQPWGEDGLLVLTSGKVPPNPSELLGSTAMTKLVRHVSDSFDVVIIDSPPLLAVTDAAILAQVASGVALVVGSDRAKKGDIERSMNALDLVGANVVGVIMNRVSTRGPDRYTYGYYERVDSDRADTTEPRKALQGERRSSTERGDIPTVSGIQNTFPSSGDRHNFEEALSGRRRRD